MAAQSPTAEYTHRVGCWRSRKPILQQDYPIGIPGDCFRRRDESRDSLLDFSPKFLYRMDPEANAALERYYAMELPIQGDILDLQA